MSWCIHCVHILTHVSSHNSISITLRQFRATFTEESDTASSACSHCNRHGRHSHKTLFPSSSQCLHFHCTFIIPSHCFYASAIVHSLGGITARSREGKNWIERPCLKYANVVGRLVSGGWRRRRRGEEKSCRGNEEGKSICKFIHLIKT